MGADGQDVSPDNIYWALKKGSDLASALEDKERAWFESARHRGLLTVWIVSYAAYYGMDPESLNIMAAAAIGFDGDEAEFLRIQINEVRSIIRQQNTMALGERPAFQAMTTNSDHRSQARAKISDTAISYLYSRYAGDAKEWAVAELDGVMGSGFGHMRWDPQGGDTVTVDTPMNGPSGPTVAKVKRKSGAPSLTTGGPWALVKEVFDMGPSAAWVMIRERDSKWNVAASYPALAEQILQEDTRDEYDFSTLFGLADIDIVNADTCTVKHFYHPDCAAVPGGRYCVIYGSLVLWDRPCPVSDGVPVREMCSGRFMETNFPYADSWSLLAIQQALNQLNSDELSNFATFGRQSVAMEKGTEITVDAIATGGKGFFYPAGGKPPQAVLMTAAPPTIGVAKEYLHKRIETISGLNAVSRGDPASNIRSGEMAALFHSIAIEYQSYRQASLDQYRIGMANMMLDMLRKYGETKFLVEVAGIEDRPYIAEFTSDDFSDITRVTLETVSPLQRTTAGKMEIYKMLAEVPPDERASAYEMITTGQSSGFLKRDRSTDLRIRRENEDLLTGERRVMVSNGDHPQKHMLGHYAELELLMASDNPDMQAMGRFQGHINEHLQAYFGMDPVFCQIMNIPAPPPIPPDPMTGRPPNPAFMFAVWQSQVPGPGAMMAGPGGPQSSGGPPDGAQPPSPGGPPGGPNAGPPQQPPQSGQADQAAVGGAQVRDPSGVKLPQPSTPPGA